MFSLQDIDLKKLIAKETNGRMRMCLLALSHVKSSANKAETARYLKVSRRIINEWVARFYANGIDCSSSDLIWQLHKICYRVFTFCPPEKVFC